MLSPRPERCHSVWNQKLVFYLLDRLRVGAISQRYPPRLATNRTLLLANVWTWTAVNVVFPITLGTNNIDYLTTKPVGSKCHVQRPMTALDIINVLRQDCQGRIGPRSWDVCQATTTKYASKGDMHSLCFNRSHSVSHNSMSV